MKKYISSKWNLCILTMILLSILAFTPLVIPVGQYEPTIAGIPRTIWAGVLLYVVMVAVTYVGTRVHPDNQKTGGDVE